MITIEIDDAALRAALGRAAAALADPSPLMADIGEYVREATKRRFAAGAGPDGVAWAPRSPATLEAYARRGDRPGARPLTGPSRALSTRIAWEMIPGGQGVAIGSGEVYAAAMQFGMPKGYAGIARNDTPIPWGDIPARPFLGLSEDDRMAIREIIAEWLSDAAGGGSGDAPSGL
jgi:phage virion morphogenesis protein